MALLERLQLIAELETRKHIFVLPPCWRQAQFHEMTWKSSLLPVNLELLWFLELNFVGLLGEVSGPKNSNLSPGVVVFNCQNFKKYKQNTAPTLKTVLKSFEKNSPKKNSLKALHDLLKTWDLQQNIIIFLSSKFCKKIAKHSSYQWLITCTNFLLDMCWCIHLFSNSATLKARHSKNQKCSLG